MENRIHGHGADAQGKQICTRDDKKIGAIQSLNALQDRTNTIASFIQYSSQELQLESLSYPQHFQRLRTRQRKKPW
jgi:hypothetical protein